MERLNRPVRMILISMSFHSMLTSILFFTSGDLLKGFSKIIYFHGHKSHGTHFVSQIRLNESMCNTVVMFGFFFDAPNIKKLSYHF